jgi:hypothetical protein
MDYKDAKRRATATVEDQYRWKWNGSGFAIDRVLIVPGGLALKLISRLRL